jgi:hypothetical protein
MTEELDQRFDKWFNDLEEKNPLKRFLVSGIQVLACLVLVGILVSKAYVYNGIYLLIEIGALPNGVIPTVLVDVLRSVVALVLCSVIMLLFLVRLETTFLRLG